MGAFLHEQFQRLSAKFPNVLREVRGLGLMLGVELAENIAAFKNSEQSFALQFINRLHHAGLLAIPAGARVIRILPALNLRPADAAEGAEIFAAVVASLSV